MDKSITKEPNNNTDKRALGSSRIQARLMVGLITEYITLDKHSFGLGLTEINSCAKWKKAGRLEYSLCQCPPIARLRQKILGSSTIPDLTYFRQKESVIYGLVSLAAGILKSSTSF